MLQIEENRNLIHENFPKPSIPRRNTGYAIDLLAKAEVFDDTEEAQFNFCKLIAGSEGTLASSQKLKCIVILFLQK